MNATPLFATIRRVLSRRFAPTTRRSTPARPPAAIRRRRTMGLVALVVFTGGGASSAAAALDCPHHDPVPAGHQADSAPTAHGPPTAHSGHETHVAPAPQTGAADAQDPHPPSHHEGPCTCLGDCAGATAIRSVDAPAAERTRETLPLRTPPAEPLLLPARFHLPHILPWPTAPPHA
ncbi:MAG: hypothetical protein WD960_09830 [Gemmatimonadota bacterium]